VAVFEEGTWPRFAAHGSCEKASLCPYPSRSLLPLGFTLYLPPQSYRQIRRTIKGNTTWPLWTCASTRKARRQTGQEEGLAPSYSRIRI